MKNTIGIGILDIYTQNDLDACYKSIPNDLKENLIIASLTNNKLPECNFKKFKTDLQFPTLKNWIISQFRIKNTIDHIFLINSNQIINDNDIFLKTIKISKVFGPQAVFGPEVSVITIEDDENKVDLVLSEKINTNFVYISNNAVSKIGYFDERFLNTKNLDSIDYIERLRVEKMYPPNGFNAIITGNIETTNSKIQKTNYKEIETRDKTVDMSYAYFMHKYQYIPTQNDPAPVSNDDLMKALEELQNTYGTK
jgi:hypothetical protein